MILKKLNGENFKELVIYGAQNLRVHYEEVDSLNVFPVPDGDTGTNMLRTIEGGVKAIEKCKTNSLSEVANEFAKGMLMSARGNSGVILSQIFRGICKGFDGHEEVDIKQFSAAFKVGVKQAYGAVVTPVEGTILTVFREATEVASEGIDDDSTINDYIALHVKQAAKTLKRTKEMLPVLKEAGVIDSGGCGYNYIANGMNKYLIGEKIEAASSISETNVECNTEVDFSGFSKDDVLQFGYCTEFILRLQSTKVDVDSFDVNKIIEELNESDIAGDSIVALKDDDIIKVHVHTKEPGLVLHKMRKYGEFLTIKCENMALQHNENMSEEEKNSLAKREHKKYAIVAVAQGDGIKKQFEALGVDYVVSGNQTMNPSTEDFIKAFKSLDAENIMVFPNNKNILMAAKQAAQLYKGSNVSVVHSVSIPQCYAALTMLDYSSDDLTLIIGNFNEAIRNVATGEITIANRTTKLNGVVINKNDHLCILDGKIVASTKLKNEIISKLLKKVPDIKNKQVLTIIYGKDVTEIEKKKNLDFIKLRFPYLEVGAIDGGQAVYKYLLAIE